MVSELIWAISFYFVLGFKLRRTYAKVHAAENSTRSHVTRLKSAPVEDLLRRVMEDINARLTALEEQLGRMATANRTNEDNHRAIMEQLQRIGEQMANPVRVERRVLEPEGEVETLRSFIKP